MHTIFNRAKGLIRSQGGRRPVQQPRDCTGAVRLDRDGRSAAHADLREAGGSQPTRAPSRAGWRAAGRRVDQTVGVREKNRGYLPMRGRDRGRDALGCERSGRRAAQRCGWRRADTRTVSPSHRVGRFVGKAAALLAAAVLVTAMTAPSASADVTVQVSTAQDESVADGQCSLREALGYAGGFTQPDCASGPAVGVVTIVVPPGCYRLASILLVSQLRRPVRW
jgi:CSLREA domain-containing protein